MQGKLNFYSKTRLICHLPPLDKEQIIKDEDSTDMTCYVAIGDPREQHH